MFTYKFKNIINSMQLSHFGMQYILRYTVTTLVFLHVTASSRAQSWEAHLNIRGINSLLNGENGSFLVKAKLGERTYARLGLQGFLTTRKQTGSVGNNILLKNFLVGFRPGLEKRSLVAEKLFFLRGADLIYDYSGSDNIPPSTGTQYSFRQRVHDLGVSPFIGLHFAVNNYVAVLAETHLDAYFQFIHSDVRNELGVTEPNRTETRVDVSIAFQPFQNLTLCFTF